MFSRNQDQYKNGLFTWFIGSVEDINDPEGLNRVRVRAYGYYDSKTIKTADLPFATVMMPVTSASIQGNGGNHHLEKGSWVVGFFRDGPSAQDPVVIGSIATQTDGVKDIPSTSSTTNKVHHTKAGHKIEFENKEGDEKITVEHAKGAKIIIDKDNNIEITNSGKTDIISDGIIKIKSKIKTKIV